MEIAQTQNHASEDGNRRGLAALNRELLLPKTETIDSPLRVVPDMTSTEIPMCGQRENRAYKDRFESTCCHPPWIFNREGDCPAS